MMIVSRHVVPCHCRSWRAPPQRGQCFFVPFGSVALIRLPLSAAEFLNAAFLGAALLGAEKLKAQLHAQLLIG